MPIAKITPRSERKLQDVADAIHKAKKVVVFTGAGISTSSGIPDFRSKDGLYSLIKTDYDNENPGSGKVVSGKDLFDSSIWRDLDTTSTFYKFIASLRNKIHNGQTKSTKAHRLLRVLRDERKLVRCYTQNIDGLESRVGLSTDISRGKGNGKRFTAKALQTPGDGSSVLKGSLRDGGCEVVQLHGDLVSLRCLNKCAATCAWQEIHNKDFLRGQAPECASCAETNSDRLRRGKRTTKVGSLRPNVVLYGEQNPSEAELSSIIENDLRLAPDLVLILGTSLKVHGLKVLVKEFAKAVHDRKELGKVVFINNTAPSPSAWDGIIDYWVQADCDKWAQDLRMRVPDLFKKQQELSPKYMTTLGSGRSPKSFESQKAKSTVQRSANIKLCSQRFQRESSPSAQRAQRLVESPAKRKPLATLTVATNVPADVLSSGMKKVNTPPKNDQLPTPPSSRRAHVPTALNPSKRMASMMAPATLDETPPSSPLDLRHVTCEREDLVQTSTSVKVDKSLLLDLTTSVSKKRGVHWMRPTDPRDLHQLYPSKRRKFEHEFAVFEDSDVGEDNFQGHEKAQTETACSQNEPPYTPSAIRVVIERKESPSSKKSDNAHNQAPHPPTTMSPTVSSKEDLFTVPETPRRKSILISKPPTPKSTTKKSGRSPGKKKTIAVSTKQEGREHTGLLGGKFETFWKKRPREGPMGFEFDTTGVPKWIVKA